MRVEKITFQLRNDFSATIKCEGCEKTQKLERGYSDAHYYSYVLPEIKCNSCGKSSNELNTLLGNIKGEV